MGTLRITNHYDSQKNTPNHYESFWIIGLTIRDSWFGPSLNKQFQVSVKSFPWRPIFGAPVQSDLWRSEYAAGVYYAFEWICMKKISFTGPAGAFFRVRFFDFYCTCFSNLLEITCLFDGPLCAFYDTFHLKNTYNKNRKNRTRKNASAGHINDIFFIQIHPKA